MPLDFCVACHASFHALSQTIISLRVIIDDVNLPKP